jgi:hypothetical protein
MINDTENVGIGTSDWFASLRDYVTADEIAKTKKIFDGHCSMELIVIATALRGLAEFTVESANLAEADERPFKAEEFLSRSADYRAIYDKIVEVWDGDIDANK